MEDWQNKMHSLCLRAKFAVEHGILTDCEFTFGKEDKVFCHKLILAMTSPVFYAMFFGEMREKTDLSIEIEDIEPQIFKQMVQYIYGGRIDISDYKNACDLYLAAKKYMLVDLEKRCIDYLLQHVDRENVIGLFEFAQFHGEVILEKKAVMEIQRQTSAILQDNSFLFANDSTLTTILELDRLNIKTECELLVAVEKWAQAQITNERRSERTLQEITKPFIQKLRLLTVTKKEFMSVVASSLLLNDSEKLSLLLRIVGTDLPPMMNGLCEKRIKRKPCRDVIRTSLQFEDISDARCDGSEWFTSIFTTNTRILLLGVEINLQKDDEDGSYRENLMIKVGLANKEDHFAEGSLVKTVPYNSTAQVMFSMPPVLEPFDQYAIHIFLCSSGIYPLGYHGKLSCFNTNVKLDFLSHTSWEQCHPWNTTVLSSLIFTDVIET